MNFVIGILFSILVLFTNGYAEDVDILAIVITERERQEIDRIVHKYEEANPDINVNFMFMDDISMQLKLPSLMYSEFKPDAYYTWSGGMLQEQAKAGWLRSVDDVMSKECRNSFTDITLAALSYNGKQVGIPKYVSELALWYNKDLAKKVGVDPEKIETWEDFLAQVKKAKEAGVTPIIVSGKSWYTLQFWYSYIAVRIVGKKGFEDALAGRNGGFNNPKWVRVGRELQRLAALDPFQPGYLGSSWDKAVGLFGNGEGLFTLSGNWVYNEHRSASITGKGLSDSQLGMISFPVIVKGNDGERATFGGIDGFAFTNGSSDAAVDFMCYYLSEENQRRAAEMGLWIPAGKTAGGALKNPFYRKVVQNLGASSWHQIFDSYLSVRSAATMGDVAVDLVAGWITPEEAARMLEESVAFDR